MVADAGLEIAAQEDVTESFRDTCQAILDVRAQLADKLRAEEGSALYDEEQEKNAAMVIGIDESLLVRSLFLIEKKGNVRRI